MHDDQSEAIEVLLVEDDPGDVVLIQEAFEDNKVRNRLHVVADGVEALAFLRREGEFADKFNAMPKFVVSTTLKDPEWNNTTVLDSGDATAQVRKLKEEFDGELQVPGSHRLVQELIESDLVDQINLMVFPVILGTGKKAFEEKPERRNLRLKESKVVGDGVLVLIYERAADRG